MKNHHENYPQIESSEARDLLKSLEQTGEYVFHGSATKIDGTISPRQATMGGKNHGEPAISATPYADIALFRAVINPTNFPEIGYGTKFGVERSDREEPRVSLAVEQSVVEKMADRETIGYVYVFPKDSFKQFEDSSYEVRSTQSLNPLDVIEVTKADLPEGIEVYDSRLE